MSSWNSNNLRQQLSKFKLWSSLTEDERYHYLRYDLEYPDWLSELYSISPTPSLEISPFSSSIITQLANQPDLLYYVISQSDFQTVRQLCSANSQIDKLCRAPHLYKLIRQKRVTYITDELIREVGGYALVSLARQGFYEGVVELIKRGRESDEIKNEAFLVASNYCQSKIVRYLLQDPSVDPSYKRNAAIHNVMNILQTDPDTAEYPITIEDRANCIEIAIMLLADKKVLSTLTDNEQKTYFSFLRSQN